MPYKTTCCALPCFAVQSVLEAMNFNRKPDVLILGFLTFQTHDGLRDKGNRVLNPVGAAYTKWPRGVAKARWISLPVVSEWTSGSSKSLSPLLVLLFPQLMDTKLHSYVFVKWMCVYVCVSGEFRLMCQLSATLKPSDEAQSYGPVLINGSPGNSVLSESEELRQRGGRAGQRGRARTLSPGVEDGLWSN